MPPVHVQKRVDRWAGVSDYMDELRVGKDLTQEADPRPATQVGDEPLSSLSVNVREHRTVNPATGVLVQVKPCELRRRRIWANPRDPDAADELIVHRLEPPDGEKTNWRSAKMLRRAN